MELNHKNYFSAEMNGKYMSSSQFKTFLECPARALKEIALPDEDKVYFREGHFFEACVNGYKDEFIAQNEDTMLTKRDKHLYENYSRVLNSATRFLQQPVFREIIAKCEQQKIITGEIAGVRFKACIDYYDPATGYEYDTKCMSSFGKVWSVTDEYSSYVPWYIGYGYNYQACIYRELIKQNFGKDAKCFLMAATKEKEPDIAYIEFSKEVLDDALTVVEYYAPKFAELKKGIGEPERCGKCDYCKATKVITEPFVATSELEII